MSEQKVTSQHLRDEFGPALTDDEIEACIQEKGLTAPRITKEGIESKITSINYMQLPPENVFTICAITLHSGFVVIGHSAPASPANFDKELGRKIAYDNAFRQLWAFEGYLFKEVMFASNAVVRRLDPDDTQAAMGHPAHE